MATVAGPDGLLRCSWSAATPAYIAYHDKEWGFPVLDDRRLFEKICLEGFQSGLSWRTILEKRENFRKAFSGFDYHAVARFDEADVERLLADAGIVRHRGKIEATINNARRAIDLEAEFGTLARYFWQYEAKAEPGFRATSPESIALSKDLKKRGWKFFGPTTAYAFMQAMGLLNDHDPECVVHGLVAQARAAATIPRA
ncbi:DNA-3-methyladenine glycosylase I [Sandaracinobacteroides hominis]|uniref:DNA-3-methyladenine glycosylase I n=1 Tax=Sandaracinobacteroides hominis TaxID=2780086 RepID=UPI0018F63845|nr:DNA-3-methyladenine glycosylase I [Sandaracinobacteroides hominis]